VPLCFRSPQCYIYRVEHKKRSKFSALEETCNKPRQNCFGNWIERWLHYSYLSHQWCYSTRHWEILDEEGTLLKSIYQKSDISPEQLNYSRSRFSKKADGKRRSFLEWKTDAFYIDLQKTKVDQNCYIDLLKTSLLLECCQLYPGNDFEFKTVLHHTVQKWCNSFYDRTLQTS